MSGVTYIRLFGDDWLSGTQELSLEERGALITIVAMTAASGIPPKLDYDRLCRRFGCTPGKAKKIIKSLVEVGKITVENDAVCNRRAIKETGISQKNSKKQSENASARWAKKEEKVNEINSGDNATALPPEYQPEPEPDKEYIDQSEPDPRFSDFWEVWPLSKVGRKKAEAAFRRLSLPKKVEAIRSARSWASAWRKKHPDASDLHPTTYLNGERWNDEYAVRQTAPRTSPVIRKQRDPLEGLPEQFGGKGANQ